MNGVDKLTNILSSYIKKDKTYPYDTEGKVKRIDKETGKAYVEFGDYGETPVDMSIDAKPGDLVKVRVSGGDAWIVGNNSAPPTDDRVARQALKTARYVKTETEKIVKRIDEGDFETQPGPPGEDAPIITGVVIEYCLATARTIPEGGTFEDIQATDWSEEIPDPVTGQFYWMRTITVMSDGTEVVSDPMFAMSVQASIEAGIAAANAQAAATTAEGIANAANATANTKRRVFNAQPTTPYDKNDMWFDGVHGKIYLCTKEGGRQTGNFTASDWTEYSEDVSNHFWYDSSGAHVAQTQGDVTTGNAQTISANGTVITRDGKLITSWTGTGANDAAINFYDLDTQTIGDSAHLVASYAKAGITQYINNKIAMALTASGLTFKSPDTNAWTEAVFGPSGADIYANNIKRTSVNSDGMTVYDSDGATPLAAFKGTGVSFNTGKPFTLGNDNSYIKWVYENGAWRIKIAADSVSFDGSAVAKADSVVSSAVPVYYRSSTHTTPTISRSTTIYTSDDTDNQWSYVMPKPSKNKYFYETIRTVAADGTITHETVREINTATYASKWVHSSDSTQIDGGALYANSVTADKINVNNLISVGGLATNSDIEDVESQAQSAIDTANSASSAASTASSNASTALSRANTAISDASDAAKTATNYLGYLSSATGLCVHDSGNTSNFVNVNSSSVNVYKSGSKVAEFGSVVKLGDISSSSGLYQEISSGGIKLYRGSTLQGGIYGSGGENSSGIEMTNTNATTRYDGAKVQCRSSGVELTHNTTNSLTGRAMAVLTKSATMSGTTGSAFELFSTNLCVEQGYGVRSNSGQLLGESEQGNVLVGWGIKDSGGALNLYGHSGIYARNVTNIEGKLHANAGGDYATSWTKQSDKRLKEKIKALNSNVDDIILDLNPVEYDLKEDESGTRYFGLIAQDVAETLEKHGYDSKKYSTVNELRNPEGYLGIDYNDFIPMLIHLCQSQQKKIDDLEERLSKLEGKLE